MSGITDVWEWDRHDGTASSPPPVPASARITRWLTTARAVASSCAAALRSDKVHPTDTWEWDGTAWRLAAADGPGPGGGYRMAYDQARAVTVLFGGDTCLWDGNIWTRVATTNAPPARQVHAMAYDPVRARVVMHGGSMDQVNAADTWEWDGATWSQA